jgi:hypothetical protein
MAFGLSVASGIEVAGAPIQATYWHAMNAQIDFVLGRINIMMGGYADAASYAANPSTPLMQQLVVCPSPANPTFVLSAAYLTANFGSSGPSAYVAALQAMVGNDPFFTGATPES